MNRGCVLCCIPVVFHAGNPGVVGFYRTFMQTLHSMFEYQYPVWAVSHAGHCAPPASMDMVEGMDYYYAPTLTVVIIQTLTLLRYQG